MNRLREYLQASSALSFAAHGQVFTDADLPQVHIRAGDYVSVMGSKPPGIVFGGMCFAANSHDGPDPITTCVLLFYSKPVCHELFRASCFGDRAAPAAQLDLLPGMMSVL